MKSIIIVDDSELIRDRIKELINSHSNCEFLAEASDGREAIHLITSLEPDIVILDIKMPHLSGIEVLQRIQGFIENITVIMFSNYASLPYQSKCMELGANHFLDKTKDFDKLKSILLS